MTEATVPRAALLAGGLGTRIRALAGNTPKVLLPVEGRPFIAHLLEYLERQGVAETVLCLGHAADRVWDAALSVAPAGLTLVPSREETPLGTGGALRLALEHLGDTFFVVNGDTYLEAPLAPLLQLHRRSEAAITLSLVRSEQAAEKGTVRVDPSGRVLDFVEKVADGTGLINGGVYVAEASAIGHCPPGKPCSLEREVIPAALRRGETIMARRTEAPFVDIGLPEDYLRVRDRLPRTGGRR
jgi:NDP-sugar pyrophosphorylase family protein